MITACSENKMYPRRWCATAVLCFGMMLSLYTPRATAQSSESEERGMTLTEYFDARSSTDGKVFSLASAGVFSRFVPRGTTVLGTVRHHRVYEKNAETLGGATLDRDNGVNVGVSYSPTHYLDFGVSYSRSMHYSLNTVSFGLGVNLGSLIGKAHGW